MVDTLFKTKTSNNDELYCVYMHINKINGKRYIGQTIKQNHISGRFGYKGNNYAKCTYFYRAIKKYGWDNFDHYIIQKNLTKEEADKLERLNILAFNTANNKFGYNLKFGGEAGGKLSEEVKQKISNSEKGRHLTEEHKKNISKAKKGKHFSEEYRQKMSETHKGINAKKVGQYTLDGKLICIYDSMTEAKKYGYNPNLISMCCTGQRNKHKGYVWKYA